MTTLNTQCKMHTPQAISAVVHSFDEWEEFAFCSDCEQNIERFFFYDEDRGSVHTKWVVSK